MADLSALLSATASEPQLPVAHNPVAGKDEVWRDHVHVRAVDLVKR